MSLTMDSIRADFDHFTNRIKDGAANILNDKSQQSDLQKKVALVAAVTFIVAIIVTPLTNALLLASLASLGYVVKRFYESGATVEEKVKSSLNSAGNAIDNSAKKLFGKNS